MNFSLNYSYLNVECICMIFLLFQRRLQLENNHWMNSNSLTRTTPINLLVTLLLRRPRIIHRILMNCIYHLSIHMECHLWNHPLILNWVN